MTPKEFGERAAKLAGQSERGSRSCIVYGTHELTFSVGPSRGWKVTFGHAIEKNGVAVAMFSEEMPWERVREAAREAGEIYYAQFLLSTFLGDGKGHYLDYRIEEPASDA